MGHPFMHSFDRLCWFFLAMALLAATVSPRAGWAFGRNKVQYENFHWKVLSTPHYEIFFYEGEENLAARAAVIAEDRRLNQEDPRQRGR